MTNSIKVFSIKLLQVFCVIILLAILSFAVKSTVEKSREVIEKIIYIDRDRQSVNTFTLNKCNHLLRQHYPNAECACFKQSESFPRTICYYPFSFGYLVVKCQSANWDSCTVGDRL